MLQGALLKCLKNSVCLFVFSFVFVYLFCCLFLSFFSLFETHDLCTELQRKLLYDYRDTLNR